MENEHLIPAKQVCTYYNVELSFISALKEYGLIEVEHIEKREFIHANQLKKLEQFTRWHYDLDINLEGIEVIEQMLQRIQNMQHEIMTLRSRLQIYEENSGRHFSNDADE